MAGSKAALLCILTQRSSFNAKDQRLRRRLERKEAVVEVATRESSGGTEQPEDEVKLDKNTFEFQRRKQQPR